MAADFEDTCPLVPEGAGAFRSGGEYRVTDPNEVRSLLKALLDQVVPLHLSGSDGSVYTTALWTVDATSQRMSFTADTFSPAVHDLLEAEECVAVGYLDRIKVQFDVGDLVLVQGRKSSVLQARLPGEVFRFQRRNTFRVRTIERTAPTASFRHPAIPDMTMVLRVLDVSIGGCALLLPGNAPELRPGALIPGVRLALDATTVIETGLLLHHVTSTGAASGTVRLGCELAGTSPVSQRVLQKYIDQTQKRRRQLALD